MYERVDSKGKTRTITKTVYEDGHLDEYLARGCDAYQLLDEQTKKAAKDNGHWKGRDSKGVLWVYWSDATKEVVSLYAVMG